MRDCGVRVNSPPEPAGLPALLEAFGAALIAPEHEAPECTAFAAELADDGIPALARLRVYRNSSRLIQREALSRTYSVLRRRVGDEYFAQLARDYLAAHPSPSGDLHWIGAAFAPWLADHLGEGDYRWLADLARLEWACERALAAADAAPLALQSLGRVPAERLDAAVLRLHPSLQFVSSPWPVWSVWQENQPDGAGRAVDPDLGPQHVGVACIDGQLVLASVPREEFAFRQSLAGGQSLAAALASSGLPVERLAGALGRLFEERLVVGLDVPEEVDAS